MDKDTLVDIHIEPWSRRYLLGVNIWNMTREPNDTHVHTNRHCRHMQLAMFV